MLPHSAELRKLWLPLLTSTDFEKFFIGLEDENKLYMEVIFRRAPNNHILNYTIALCFILPKPRQNHAKYVISKPREFPFDIHAIIYIKYPLMKPKIKSCHKSPLKKSKFLY